MLNAEPAIKRQLSSIKLDIKEIGKSEKVIFFSLNWFNLENTSTFIFHKIVYDNTCLLLSDSINTSFQWFSVLISNMVNINRYNLLLRTKTGHETKILRTSGVKE